MEINGVLPLGVTYAGTIHKDFSLRPALVKDTIEALEESEDKMALMGLAKLARQITRLGDIPLEAIKTELLLGMYEADLDVLEKAQESLEKKARGIEESPK